jgi:catabolite regulation protein CreA
MLMVGRVAQAEQIGSVDTVFKMFGPDHKIVVEAFDDPDVKNVTCYISRAKTGGIKGGLGLAEDTSDAAISCQQVGPVELSDKIKNGKAQGDVVFQKRPRWCSKSCRSCVSMMPNATRWLIWPIPTKWWKVRRKTRSARCRLCRGINSGMNHATTCGLAG